MKKKLYLQLALLCLSLLASLNVIYAQCPVSCTFTEANGPNINFSGNQTLCIGTNTGDLNINFNGSNNVICVAPGVTWTQTNGLNLSGVTINVYGTWVMNGGINANSASVINIYSGATFTTNSTGFGNNLTINNAGATTFTATGQISNAGNFVFNNTAGATLTATATSLFVVGNGNMVDNYGTMTFSNLENSEANLFYNRSTGFISIGRYFYNHGAFLNEGEVETICGPFGAVACEFIVGDKGPGKTFVNNSCFSVTGNVRFDGPATNNDEFEIINGNLTINKPVTGTNGRFIVTNGVSTINLAGSYAGTNLRICDQNTAGNGFDVVNNTPSSNLYTVDCSPNACTSVFEAQIAQLCDEGAPNEGTVLTVTANGAPSGNWVLRTFNNPGQVWASGANGDLVEATGVPIGTTVEVVDAVTSTSIATITNAGGATFLTIQDDDGTPASPEGGSNLGCQNELSCPPSGLFDLISNGLAGSYSSGNPGGIIGSRVLAGPHNGNFNAVIFGSFTNSDGTGDSEGRLAVQGNFSASGSYTIGGGAPTSTGGLHAPQGWDNLVVGGDVNHTSAFAGVRGNLLYNTATDLPPFSGGFSGIPGIYRQHAPDVNWSAAKSYFETISSTYSPANVTANCPSRQSGAVTDNGGGSFDLDAQNSSAVVVFDLSPFAGTLTSTPVFNFENVGNAASILLLYPGAAVTFAGGSISIDGATATAPYAGAEKDLIEKTLWNFYEATTFNFSAYAILGSVLAPFTTAVSLSGGQMNGQTILAGNITQSGGFEFHNFCFTGDLSSCVVCPAPITVNAVTTSPVCEGNSFTVTIGHVADPGDLALYYGAAGLTAAQVYDHSNNGLTQLGVNITPASMATSTVSGSLSIATPGTYTIYARLAAGNPNINDPGCLPFGTGVITVFPEPVVTLNDPADVCVDGSDMSFTASPVGGVFTTNAPAGFSSNGAAGTATLDVSAAGAGTYTVTYTYTDANGCDASQTVSVTIYPEPVVTLNDPADVCVDGSDMSFTASPVGGVFTTNAPAGFSSNGAAGTASLDVSAAGAGTYTVIYTYTDANGCDASQTVSVTIYPEPVVTLNDPADVCVDGSDMSFTAGPVGGVFTTNAPAGFSSNGAAGTATLDVSAAGAGTYTVTYTYTDANGCDASQTVSVTIYPEPVVTLNDPADVCVDGSDMSFTASPVGGVFTTNAPAGFSSNGAAGTASLDVSAAGAGTYTVIYTYTDANGCDASQTVSVTIYPEPVVTLNDPADVCVDGSDMSFTAGPVGGVFTTNAPAGFSSNGAAGTATLDVSTAGAGTYTVTYTYTDANGCDASQTVSVTIYPEPVVTLNDPADVCADGADMSFTASPVGGVFTTNAPAGFSSNGAAGTATLDVSAAGAGTYTVTYTYTDANGCDASQTVSVTIYPEPVVTLNDPADVCVDGSDMSFIASPVGGVFTTNAPAGFSSNGAAGTATLDVSAAGAGTYTVTYTYTDANGCDASQTVSVTIYPEPVVTLSDPADVCVDGADMSFTAGPVGGVFTTNAPAGFSSNGAAGTATLDVSAAGAGTYTVTYTYTDANGCDASQTVSVTIYPEPVAVISATDASCTLNDMIIQQGSSATLTASGGTSYVWDDNSTDPIRVVNPMATTTYTVVVTDANGCIDEETKVITVVDPLSIVLTVPVTNPTSCIINDGAIYITASGGTAPYIYDWSDIAGTNNIEDRTGLNSGIYRVTVTDANGCQEVFETTLLGECVAVGNYVFMDNNDNGVYNAGTDMPLANVAVVLYSAGSTVGVTAPVATTTTNANGYYYFDQLTASDYFVHIPASNFASGQPLFNKESYPGADNTDNTDNNDNGGDSPVNGGISSNTFTLTLNAEPTGETQTDYPGALDDNNVNGTIDFTFRTEKVAVGNYVFMDNNDNGTFESGTDMAIPNVAVHLYAAGATVGVTPTVATTTTNTNGYYYFDQLTAGDYFVHIPASNFASGQPLFNKESYPGADNTDNTDNNDNGSDTPVAGGTSSNTFTLTPNAEPTGETQTDYPGVLDDNNVNGTIDFTFRTEKVAVGNYVFMDNNDNGVYNAGTDMPLANVAVVLYSAGSTVGVTAPIATTTTNANGYYYFDQLTAGDYFVHIPASNFASGQPLFNKESYPGADNTNNTDNNDNGGDSPVNGGISSNTFTLTPNAEPTGETQTDYPGVLDDNNVNGTIDFTFRTEKVAVGNYVFMDNNDNGVYNAGTDMPLANVAVVLYSAGATVGVTAPVATTTTNANGYYYFDQLTAGDYFVHIPASNFASGQPLFNKESYPGADNTDNTDNNDNGGDSPVNGGISSNTFTLTPNAEPTGETQTDYPGALDDNNVNGTIDFTFRTEKVAVGNYVFMDNNDNGVYNAGTDMPIANVAVVLYASGATVGVTAPVATTSTNVNGYYYFDQLTAGDYFVHIPASNFASGQPLFNKESYPGDDNTNNTDNNDNGGDTPVNGGTSSNTFTLTPNAEPTGETQTDYPGALDDDNVNGTIDFTFRTEKVAVGNYVFMDNNDNGVYNAGTDMPLANVAVVLYASGATVGVTAPIASTSTNANGYYYFDNLTAGDYFVHIPASNFASGQPLFNKESYPGADNTDNTDNNDNGGDTPVAGGTSSNTFTLTPNAEPTGETQTDYPGALDDNNVNGTIDFTFRTEKVAVGNYVFMDNNDNGTFESGTDMAIPNVAVHLYAAGATVGVTPTVATTTTNTNGYYYFDQLTAGDYFVHIPASNFASGQPLFNKESYPGADNTDNTDNNDNGSDTPVAGGTSSNTFTLTPNAEPTGETQTDYPGVLDDNNVNGTIDFTFRTEKVAVGNYVFMDNNDNGVYNAGTDMPLANVAVVLYSAGSTVGVTAPVATTTTNANGYYYFDQLTAGDYFVHIPASNFASGQPLFNKESYPGADNTNNTDNNDNGGDSPVNGGISSNTFTLTPNAEPTGETQTDYPGALDDNNVNGTIDFTFRTEKVAVGNYVFMDNNDNGVYNAGTDMPLANVAVVLYASGATVGVTAPIATTTTNANGYYYFDQLTAGDYFVHIPASNFASGQSLFNKESYPGDDNTNNTDNNDNGGDSPVNGGISSNTFTLTPNAEPTGETQTDYPGVLDDNNVNGTIDFTFRTEKVAVGNYVFMDNNDNGVYNAGTDMPLANVAVVLYSAGSTVGVTAPIATTTTNANGYYYFDQLTAGDYFVHIPASNFASGQPLFNKESYPGADNTDNTDNNDNGSDTPVAGGTSSNTFTLTPNAEPTGETQTDYPGVLDDNNVNGTIDFTFRTEKVAVGNYVFMDNNDNGVYNAGTDMPLANVAVVLYSAGSTVGVTAPIATTTTNANGYYYFDNLTAGDYFVHIPASNFASGQPLFNKESYPGDDNTDNTDNNDNGGDSPVNGGISSNTFTLTPNAEPTGETQTDYPGVLDDNNVNGTIDFTFRTEKVAVGNYVFMDNNDNGTFESGTDMAIPNVAVHLYAAGATVGVTPTVATTTTNTNGYYYFDQLTVGDYFVHISASNFASGQPLFNKESYPGADNTDNTDNNDNGSDTPVNGGISSNTFTLTPNAEPTGETQTDYLGVLDDNNVNGTIDFTFRTEKVAVGNYVFMDNNDNGVYNAGTDMPLANVAVLLYSAGSTVGVTAPVATTTTNANGYYYFDQLTAGDYFVHIPASNFASGQPLFNKESYPGADNTNNTDNNDNGGDSPVNGGISSNTFTLTPNAEPTGETQTDYPGVLDDNNVNGTIDFTFRTEKVAVGSYVFMDVNDNGTFESGTDMPIAGVTVQLYAAGDVPGTDAPLFTTSTNANGYYYFDNLTAGDYFVHIPASNFASGQPLQDKESYPGADNGDVVDNNDNGQDTPVNGGISSNTFTLMPNAEPTGETQTDYSGVLDDNNVNGTIDFTFAITCRPIACVEVKIKLDNNCERLITPEIVLAGSNLITSSTRYELLVADINGQPVLNNLVTGKYAGQRLRYLIKDRLCPDFFCWGEIVVEDGSQPKIVRADFSTTPVYCFDTDFVLNNPKTVGNLGVKPSPRQNPAGTIVAGTVADEVLNLGIAEFTSCDPTCRLSVKWSDRLVTYGCDSLAKNGLWARIYRTWVATSSCNGMSKDIVQVIELRRPALNEFGFVNTSRSGVKTQSGAGAGATNYDWVVEYNNCSADKSLIQKGDWMPRINSTFHMPPDLSRQLYLDQVECNYSVQIKDTEFPICGGKGVKIDRELYVFDWCAGGIVDTFHILIKIGDFEAPSLEYAHHAPNALSTGPMDCTAAFPISVAGIKSTFGVEVKDNCGVANVSVRVKTKDRYVKGILVAPNTWEQVEYAVMNGMMVGLPVGRHRLIIDAYDGCYNAMRDSFEFEVLDKIAPVMKCDDDLHVTLSNANGYTNGYAQVTATDIDEGSWDNCKLAWVRVRRNVPDNCTSSFIAKGYDSNGNGKLDPMPADGDWTKADGFDINGDGDLADFGETFILKEGKLMTPLQDIVEFFCCDLSERVTIELWGEDASGNRSFCWNDLLLEDKVTPTCIAPWDVTIYCDDKNLATIDDRTASAAIWGDVRVSSGDDCAALNIEYRTVKSLKCGAGYIDRIWTLTKQTVKGPITITCSQRITILPFREYNICFPKDISTDCKTPIIDTVIVDELGCDILAVNVTDKRYDASDDECYKIFRTYSVINWCTYDDRCGDPLEQTNISIIDRAVFGNYGKAPIYLLVRDRENNRRDGIEEFYISKDLVHANADDIRVYPPYCSVAEEFYHSFIYTQIIKVYDEERPVVSGVRDTFCTDPAACAASITKVVTIKDNCTDKVELERQMLMIAPFQTLDAGKMIMYATPRWSTKDLGNGQFEIKVSNLPEGLHDLIVVGRDECGNLSTATRIPFVVKDCKSPAPICINGLSTELMPDGTGGGMMAVWASDFVASKIYDCNGQGPETKDGLKVITKYSINRVGQAANVNQTSLNLTCADAGKTVLVELHAWDEAGNHDFCVTYIEVQDNRKVCAGSVDAGEISGLITTDELEPVLGVNVDLSGGAQLNQNTGSNGIYVFNNLQKAQDYTITAQLDKDHINGVSTLDLVHIQKHILGVKALDNPYRMIAADVNNSRTITTLDMIQIRKLILNIDTKFNSVPSWKFVDATYKFPDPSNPWSAQFPEVANINDLEGKVKADFIAIKMGDVNGNASVNGSVAVGTRGDKAILISTDEQQLESGQNYTVVFKAKDLAKIQGYQFTLSIDPSLATIQGIDYSGVMKAENFGIFTKDGMITTSFVRAPLAGALPLAGAQTLAGAGAPVQGQPLRGDEILFTLKLKAESNTALSRTLSLNSRLTHVEAYNQSEEVMGVQLAFGTEAVAERAALLQNVPNPFFEETAIGFYLPKATKVVLTIRDVKGAMIYKVEGNYPKGNNQLTLKQEQLKATGVLYYTLETTDFTDTKKMVLLQR